jgi:hypothetical protein
VADPNLAEPGEPLEPDDITRTVDAILASFLPECPACHTVFRPQERARQEYRSMLEDLVRARGGTA